MERIAYLILGNSTAGIAAAEAIRSVDDGGRLVIVSEEPYHTYSRPLISYLLTGERDIEQMTYRPSDFYEKIKARAFLGLKIESIACDSREVIASNGERIGFDKLLIATGGRPIVPPLKGAEKRGIFTFTAYDDAKRVKNFMDREKCGDAVVVGGGLIGLQAAEALSGAGMRVTVVELLKRVLAPVLDEPASRLIEDDFKRNGVRIITGAAAKEVHGRPGNNGAAGWLVLDGGEKVKCDLVIMAVGVAPRTDLVVGTEIKVNRGILVDNHMETSAPGIYAAGDVAEAYDLLLDANRPIPILPNAYIEGRNAGFNMAGTETDFSGEIAMNSSHFFGFPVISAGIVNPGDGEGFEILSELDSEKRCYRKLVLKDGALVGAVFAGDAVDRAGIYVNLITSRTPVAGFKENLLLPDFGYIDMPQGLRKEKLGSVR